MSKGNDAATMLAQMALDIVKHDKKALMAQKEPAKVRARLKVQYAVRSGKMKRPTSCDQCGAIGQTESHHPDYNKPMEVEHLCRKCHKKMHKKEPTR